MMRSLIVLLSLVFSFNVFAAESIVYNGKRGVFIEEEEAKKLLQKVEVEFPSLQKQNELLAKELKLKTEMDTIYNERIKTEEEIVKKWQDNYGILSKQLAGYKSEDDLNHYIYVGLFSGGTLIGCLVMYAASLVLENINK